MTCQLLTLVSPDLLHRRLVDSEFCLLTHLPDLSIGHFPRDFCRLTVMNPRFLETLMPLLDSHLADILLLLHRIAEIVMENSIYEHHVSKEHINDLSSLSRITLDVYAHI